ncbi:MAG: SIMPL domain-containing protein [Bacteroidales bacterium]|nr:SIMPL domain-containing protein [Bacteroidales bacterium]
MKKIFFLILVGLGYVNLHAQTKNFIDQPYIETSATADTLVTPDEIYLSITIAESDTKGKVSVEEMAGKMEQQLKHLGIDIKKQLTLNDLSSNFKKYFLRSKDVEKTKSYMLLVHTAVMAGKVMIALEDINIGNVNLERTAYSHPEKIQLLLRSRAIEKAYQQALALTHPLGQKVGNALYINDQTYNVRPLMKNAGIRIRGVSTLQTEKKEPLAIDFEKVKFQSGVSVRFKLLPPAQ